MAAPRKYPDELRDRATRMAMEARRDPATRPGTFRRVGEQLEINPSDSAQLGPAGRDRRRPPSRHHDQRSPTRERAGEGSARTAPCQRDPAVGLGLIRQRSSTAHSADHRLHRQPQAPVRRRADLQDADRSRDADRAEHLLRRQVPPALGPLSARRAAAGRDPPGACGEPRRLRCAEDPRTAAP